MSQAMTTAEQHEARLLSEAEAKGLFDTSSTSIAISEKAEAEAEAVERFYGITPQNIGGKEGRRSHGKHARPTSGSGGGSYAKMRLHKPSKDELKAVLQGKG